MELDRAIKKRRSYRSLEKIKITEDLIKDLSAVASLAPSCFNNQPWRFGFVYDTSRLEELFGALNKGNEWARKSSMIIAVVSEPGLDCLSEGREYYLFDSGMATAFLLLKATELGLVAHAMAGFKEGKVKSVLKIPQEMKVIALVAVGVKASEIDPGLNEFQTKTEKERPARLSFEKFVFLNEYGNVTVSS